MAQKTAADTELEADIQALEVGTRQLKIQYDMFFAGSVKLPPLEMRKRLEQLIRRHMDSSHASYAHQFHFNTVMSRFNSLAELWDKTLRGREQGYHANGRLVETGAAAVLAQKAVKPVGILATCRVRDAHADADRLKSLYDTFVEAHPEGARTPSFEKFVLGVEAQSGRLRKKSGCDEIELRVVAKDGKIQLKARPSR